MRTMPKEISLVSGAVAFLLSALTAYAGAPTGHPDSIDPRLKGPLISVFDAKGYRSFRTSFRENIAAYLWDNRDRLATTDFPTRQEVDVLVCLLSDEGVSSLDEFSGAPGFKSWCETILRPRGAHVRKPGG